MKVLHLPFTYHPDPPGGTEVYVAALVRHLGELGIRSAVAAPWGRGIEEAYDHDGARVHRFPVPPPGDLRAMYGSGDPAAAASIRRVIEAERPDVLHMHAHTRALSALVAREAREAGLPVVFTYHTPTVSCQRGTLLRYGRIPCDGRVLVTRCSACMAQQHGAGAASWLLALVPPFVGRLLGRLGMAHRPWAALRLTELLSLRKRAFHELMTQASAVVAVSAWVRDLLLRNRVSAERIVLSRQGTDVVRQAPVARLRAAGDTVKAVMLGRIDWAKGLGVVLGALARVPALKIEVDVYGIDQDPLSKEHPLLALVRQEPRVRLLPPVPNTEVARVIAGYDVTLVPSQVLETGPLVVLESFAAGVPVVGSSLGGIAERVRDGVDGLLLDAADEGAWATCLSRLVADPGVLRTLVAGIEPQRTMRHVAEEMREVYGRVLQPLPARLDGPRAGGAR